MNSSWSLTDMPDQTGRIALVTGANAGLGFEIASALANAGATVLMACRNVEKGEAARAQIVAKNPRAAVEVMKLDLAVLSSVRAAAQAFLQSGRPLHLLINNAGLMAVDRSKTVDGFETQLGVNHLGHFVLTAELIDVLLRTPGSRIINMSSMGHRMGKMHFEDLMFEKKYDRWKPYFQSKLANLLFTAELHRRLQATGGHTTRVLSAHPGASRTDLGTEGKGLTNRLLSVVMLLGQSVKKGAEPALRAATDPEAQSGQFYGPHKRSRGHAVVETPSEQAQNQADAQRLWAESERLTRQSWLAL